MSTTPAHLASRNAAYEKLTVFFDRLEEEVRRGFRGCTRSGEFEVSLKLKKLGLLKSVVEHAYTNTLKGEEGLQDALRAEIASLCDLSDAGMVADRLDQLGRQEEVTENAGYALFGNVLSVLDIVERFAKGEPCFDEAILQHQEDQLIGGYVASGWQVESAQRAFTGAARQIHTQVHNDVVGFSQQLRGFIMGLDGPTHAPMYAAVPVTTARAQLTA